MKDQKKLYSARLLEKTRRRQASGGRRRGYRLLLGLLLSTAISFFAYRRRSLSRSGVAGAVVTGTTTFGLGGWDWGLSLIFFFVSSSTLSHFREREKAAAAADKFSKGSRRDLGQVAANGGTATLLALGYGLAQTHVLRETLRAGLHRLVLELLRWVRWLWEPCSGRCSAFARRFPSCLHWD